MKDALKLKAQKSTPLKSEPKSKTLTKILFQTSIKYTFYFCISSFLSFNVFLSQFISPLYYQLVNEHETATVSYVQSLRDFGLFSFELMKFKDIYGKGFEKDVFDQEIQKEQMINKFEQILNKNPYAKDALYSLYLLYNENGDTKKAGEYLKRAKEVDPSIKSTQKPQNIYR